MASIRDVAIKAGVGIGTVSRALNGSGYISDETKQKIIAARQEEADRQFKEAGESKQAAEEARKQYEASLANAEEAKKQVLQEARQTADAEYKRIVSDAEKTAKQVKEDAITDAENQKAQILKKAEKDIADMVVDATVKIVGEKKGADVDNALYDKFLDKAGDET